MIKWGRFAVLLLLLILTATALNASNGAINQLTGENRPAIIGADCKHSNIHLHFLGKSYVYEQDKLQETLDKMGQHSRRSPEYITQYFAKYMRIFRAVFAQ